MPHTLYTRSTPAAAPSPAPLVCMRPRLTKQRPQAGSYSKAPRSPISPRKASRASSALPPASALAATTVGLATMTPLPTAGFEIVACTPGCPCAAARRRAAAAAAASILCGCRRTDGGASLSTDELMLAASTGTGAAFGGALIAALAAKRCAGFLGGGGGGRPLEGSQDGAG